MALSEGQLAFCAEWCEKHVTTWQIFRKGEWKYQWHGKTLVRYVDAVQVRTEELSALLEYLASDACVSTLALNKQGISGDWKPVNAWYEVNQKPNGALGGVRLYHALMVHPENGGDGPYVVEDGCMWKVSWTFYWKQQSVIALPASSSGINYRIANLTRDDENGTFSYVLEKRERVQQDIAEYETAKTSFETHTEEQHLGVKQSHVAGTGKQASVGGGKTVRRKLRKNEDCTTDVINETTEEVAVEGAVTETEARLRGTEKVTVNRNMSTKAAETGLPVGKSVRNEKTDGGRWTQTIREFVASVAGTLRRVCRKTAFRHTQAETTNVKNDPGFSHVEAAGGGIVREADVQKTEFDTFDVTETETEEIPVAGAVTETRRFVDGTVTRTVNRSQPSKAGASGLRVGESVRNEMTDGGAWDQTVETISAEPAGMLGATCEQNALYHAHGVTNGTGRDIPGTVDAQALPGSVVTRRARISDRGIWEVTDETRSAKPAEGTADGGAQNRLLTVTSHRNKDSIEPSTPGANEEFDVSVQRNEYGLLDGTVRKTTFVPTSSHAEGGSVLHSEITDVFENTTDGGIADKTPTKGVVYSTSSSPNDHGSYRVVVTQRTARPMQDKKEWDDVNESHSLVTTYRCGIFIYRNYSYIPDKPEGWSSAKCSVEINEYGLLDVKWTCSRLVSSVSNDGRGHGMGEQYDKHYNVKTYKYCIHNGKYYRKMFTGDKRFLVSTMRNMRTEVWAASKNDRPDIGWVSGFDPNGWAVIYSGIKEGKWTAIQKLPANVTDVPVI